MLLVSSPDVVDGAYPSVVFRYAFDVARYCGVDFVQLIWIAL